MSDKKQSDGIDALNAPGPDPRHPYSRRKLGSPCPAISTMINHSYLTPKDVEEDISIRQLATAMVECYNLSWTFAILFAIAGILGLGRWTSFNIIQLGVHGKIEHDASISRFDVSKGDALNPNSGLVDSFLKEVKDRNLGEKASRNDGEIDLVTLEDFARKKASLEVNLKAPSLLQSKAFINFVGRGESCLALLVSLHTDRSAGHHPISARADWLRVWFAEERLPVDLGWRRPNGKIGLLHTLRLISRMGKIQRAIRPSVE